MEPKLKSSSKFLKWKLASNAYNASSEIREPDIKNIKNIIKKFLRGAKTLKTSKRVKYGIPIRSVTDS